MKAMAILATGLIGVSSPSVVAQSTNSYPSLVIPSQSLEDALDAYAAATGLQMLYDASLARGRRSSRVAGAPNARAGLDLLLRGTGLSARFTGGDAVIIYADTSAVELNPITATAPPTLGSASPDPEMLAYVEVVRAGLVRIARRDPLLSSESYRLSIAVWIENDGKIEKVEILRGSGRADLDARFATSAIGVPMRSRPPAELPQPLRVELSVRQQRQD